MAPKYQWAIHPDILSIDTQPKILSALESTSFIASSMEKALDQATDSEYSVYMDLHNQQLRLWNLTNRLYPPFTTQHLVNDWFQRQKTLGLKQEPLSKAFGLQKYKHHILDTTSGLGKDSFTLASLGAKVTMLEKESIIAFFVGYALKYGESDPSIQATLSQMTSLFGNGFHHERSQYTGIYCDPMFEHKKNKSAKNKLSMQLLQLICSPEDSHELCTSCIDELAPKQRLVIKKSANQPAIEKRLNFQIKGKSIRYDIYLGV